MRRLDELSLNAWPALQTTLLDGWLLRWADGYTKRANSINALYAGILPLHQKIVQVETFYQQQRMPAVFRLTPFSQPPELDEILAARGYEVIDLTNAQTLRLKGKPAHFSKCRQVSLAEWMPTHQQFAGMMADSVLKHTMLLQQLLLPHGYFVLENAGIPVACGLGVLENNHLGIFDVVTDPNQRRQGYGRKLMESMLRWGHEQGAHTAYLQVMGSNEGAGALYAGMGFETAYQYWYRKKPPPRPQGFPKPFRVSGTN